MNYKTQRKANSRSKEEISEIMSRVHSCDTSVEVIFRKALWSRGLRYTLHSSKLPGKPDIVLPSRRTVIFIDGDYWHGGQWYRRNHPSLEDQYMVCEEEKKNYWTDKIRKNMSRDCAATEALLSDGWHVLRFWESEVKDDIENCVQKVIDTVSNGVEPSPMSVLPQRTFAEFFAGIGLMRIGLEKQGWSIAYANDIDPQKYEIYLEYFGDADTHFHLGDIHKISAESIPTVTMATASFPCNDLSLAGARAGLGGKQSSAYWGFIRILKEMGTRRPPLVLLENVTGFLTSHRGTDFRNALEALNELGYFVDAFILDAVNFVPQSRKRLFVMAMIEDGNGYRGSEKDFFLSESDTRHKPLLDFIIKNPQIKWSIRNLPRQPIRKIPLETIIDDLPETAPEWWSHDRSVYLLNQMSLRHSKKAEEMISGSVWSYGTVFRRIRNGKSMAELRTDGVAGCLRTPRGGSGRQILFKAGKGKYFVRLLTPRECARLMGADDFNTSVPLNKALFGFGDAVCVPVIEWIMKHYINPVVNELIRSRLLKLTAGEIQNE